jgi:hypothetical protein
VHGVPGRGIRSVHRIDEDLDSEAFERRVCEEAQVTYRSMTNILCGARSQQLLVVAATDLHMERWLHKSRITARELVTIMGDVSRSRSDHVRRSSMVKDRQRAI